MRVQILITCLRRKKKYACCMLILGYLLLLKRFLKTGDLELVCHVSFGQWTLRTIRSKYDTIGEWEETLFTER